MGMEHTPTTHMDTTTTPNDKSPVVVRIGRMGSKTHLGWEWVNMTSRLFPSCGNDSPFKPSRKMAHLKLSDISCIKCRKKAVELNLISA